MIVLSFARCVALVYIYMQFRNLRRIGAKHLLGKKLLKLFHLLNSYYKFKNSWTFYVHNRWQTLLR